MKDNVEQSIVHKAIIRGGIHFYMYSDALELIDICEKNGYPILGIDSFIVTEKKTQPFLEDSIDFSNSENTALFEKSYESAKEFLKSKRSFGFVFEVVYLE
jgi:hypothetical protein